MQNKNLGDGTVKHLEKNMGIRYNKMNDWT